MSGNKQLRWAVLGTGIIANEMAQTLQSVGRTLDAVGGRTCAKAEAFAEKYGVPKVYGDYREMFSDPEIDAVYIATPHNTHIGSLEEALSHGKHVLCEKSITLNSAELERARRLAEENHAVLAEAMTIWHMPLYKRLWDMVRNGELGKVQMITVNFGSFKPYDMKNRFFNMDLAGGALLDIGVYALSLVRSFMEETPDTVCSQWRPSPTGSDEQATILLKNASGQMAAVALSMHAKQPKRAMISGEKGYIEIMEFPRAAGAVIVDAETGERRDCIAGETENALYYEMTDMEEAVRAQDLSLMKLSFTRDVMAVMTALRKDWGMRYPGEAW